MIVERAEMQIRKGSEDGFATVLKEQATPIIAAFPGVLSVQYGRGIENNDKFLLLVTWDSLDSHTAFTKSEVFPGFRAALMPYSVGGAMEHFTMERAPPGKS